VDSRNRGVVQKSLVYFRTDRCDIGDGNIVNEDLESSEVHSRLGFDRFKSGFVVNVRQFFGVV
jgi:hypothetical protein